MPGTKPRGRLIYQAKRGFLCGRTSWPGGLMSPAESFNSTGAISGAVVQVPEINYHFTLAYQYLSLPGWPRARGVVGVMNGRDAFATFDRWRARRTANWADRDGSPGSLSRCPRSLGRISARHPTLLSIIALIPRSLRAPAKRLLCCYWDAVLGNADDAASFNWGASSSKTGVGFVLCGAMNSHMRCATSFCAMRNWSKVIYYLPTHLVCARRF